MKVGELIEQLRQNFDPNDDVYMEYDSYAIVLVDTIEDHEEMTGEGKGPVIR